MVTKDAQRLKVILWSFQMDKGGEERKGKERTSELLLSLQPPPSGSCTFASLTGTWLPSQAPVGGRRFHVGLQVKSRERGQLGGSGGASLCTEFPSKRALSVHFGRVLYLLTGSLLPLSEKSASLEIVTCLCFITSILLGSHCTGLSFHNINFLTIYLGCPTLKNPHSRLFFTISFFCLER